MNKPVILKNPQPILDIFSNPYWQENCFEEMEEYVLDKGDYFDPADYSTIAKEDFDYCPDVLKVLRTTPILQLEGADVFIQGWEAEVLKIDPEGDFAKELPPVGSKVILLASWIVVCGKEVTPEAVKLIEPYLS